MKIELRKLSEIKPYANNRRVNDAADNWKPSKKKSIERIDGIVALIMAVDRASVLLRTELECWANSVGINATSASFRPTSSSPRWGLCTVTCRRRGCRGFLIWSLCRR